MNFPDTERVFVDLIPLTGFEGKEPRIAPRNVSEATRDKEPVLADYLEPIKPNSYLCKPRVFDIVEDNEEDGQIRDGPQLSKYIQILDDFWLEPTKSNYMNCWLTDGFYLMYKNKIQLNLIKRRHINWLNKVLEILDFLS